jgi:hypothetical protein
VSLLLLIKNGQGAAGGGVAQGAINTRRILLLQAG